MTRLIDYSYLANRVTSGQVQGFKIWAQNRPEYASGSMTGQIVALIIGLVFLGIVTFFTVVGTVAIVGTATSQGYPVALLGLIVPLIAIGLLGLAIWGTARFAGSNKRWERWFRLEGFARSNQLQFSPLDANPQYPGAIFSSGSNRAAYDHLRSTSGRFLDYGNYRYVTSNGKSSTTHTWGFLALQLDRSLPHIVLDSLANNGIFGSSLSTYDKNQVLSLEGDFDKYFTLYCPAEYERDALYVFTPDLMALCIDNAAPFDVEIIDKWMFVYSARPFDMMQPYVHHRLLSIVETVGAKTLRQTARYSDERIGNFAANVVAPPGQRLKRKFPVWAIVMLVVLFGSILLVPAIAILAAFASVLGQQ